MTPERTKKLKLASQRRQNNLTVILENVHDPHNIGAVLRTCDSVGIKEIFVLYTDPRLQTSQLKINKRTSSGARRWVDVHLFSDPEACFSRVRDQYKYIFSTHLSEDAKSLYELDLSDSVALLFGNERDGLTDISLSYSDGNFIIPQMGLVQSLNISVACAVCLYEAFRQRDRNGMYTESLPMSIDQQQELFGVFKERQLKRDKGSFTQLIK